jgi:type IV pilus assembly protein PilB
MVLVTGPTGSGKTTTLYAAINEINTKEDKFITIEDPVEYLLKGVIQIPVNEKKGLTFARGLRSILRHDPDKIMVGEIRDVETAQIAIASALTGHLVFTTVHANNAFDVIGRFVNMGIEPYNFVSSLNCIMAQRLIRTICPSCKTLVSVTRRQCEEFDLINRPKDQPFYGERDAWNAMVSISGTAGYYGVSSLTDPIKALILDRKPTAEVRKAALADGMTTLREAGLEKVLKGETTLREMNRITFVG